MSSRVVPALFLLVAFSPAARAEIAVEVQNGLVNVRASAAPVAEVVQRLGEKTAVRVTFSDLPTRLVSLELRGLQPRQALERVLAWMDPGFGYVLGFSPDGARVVAVIVTPPGRVVAARPDPFEPRPGKGEALERVPEAWELEARRQSAEVAPTPSPELAAFRPSPPVDPREPTFGTGIDPFTPPEGRGDRPEPVRDVHQR
jgi:hypothetical protein